MLGSRLVSQVSPSQPLFETLLVFENYRLDAMMRAQGRAWAHRSVELHELTNFPITLAAYDGEELSFKIEFDRRRLDDETASSRCSSHLRTLLDAISTRPAAAVRDLPLLPETERRLLVEEFNSPRHAPIECALPLDGGATLHELFEAQVRRSPEAIALTCDGESLTYEQLNTESNRLARYLVECGVAPDDAGRPQRRSVQQSW